MEFPFGSHWWPPNIAVGVAAGVAALSLLWWLLTRRPSGLPPGPGPAMPLLGHLLLVDKDPREQFGAWRRQYGDVFSLYMGRRLVVVLNGLGVIKEAFVHQADVFSNRPDTFVFKGICKDRGVSGNSGWRWKEQRKASLEILRQLGLGKVTMADRIQEEVTQFLKALHDTQGAPVDVAEMTHVSISNNICSILFGQRFEYGDPAFARYLNIVADNLKTAGGTAILNFFPALKHLPGDVFNYKKVITNTKLLHSALLRPQMESHMNRSPDDDRRDFISLYIKQMRELREEGRPSSIDEDNLLQLLADFFFAGTETTSTTIRWALVFLLHHPHVQDECYDQLCRVVGTDRAPSVRDRPELTYVEATIMEVMRLSNVTPFALHHGLSEEAMLRGYRLPKDSIILPSLQSVLHDPEIWHNPLDFRPQRFIGPDGRLQRPEEFIPFGTGRRICAGEPLARMELFLYLSNMMQLFRFLPPEDGTLPSLQGVLGLTYEPKPFKLRFCVRANRM